MTKEMRDISLFNKGFTLIEISIVLVILSMIIGIMATVIPIQDDKDANKLTTENLKIIERAMLAYFNQNGYLPCPASKSATLSSANFGTVTTCSTVGSSLPAYAEVGAGADRIRIGAVPTRELNIADSYAFDGWNNRITYSVATDLAQTSILYNSHTSLTTGITIIDNAGNTMHALSPNFVAYTLVSHGTDGMGATNYSGSGIALTCAGVRKDVENCNNDAIFRDQFADTNSFDDQILWKTKAQISLESLTPSTSTGALSPVKYGMWVQRSSGATNVPKAVANWDLRTISTQLYNTTGVTATATQMTFPPGDYYIKESHMACGTGPTMFARFTLASAQVSISDVVYLDELATNKPCAWITSNTHYVVPAGPSITTEAYLWSRFTEPTYGNGRGFNTGFGDQYVFSRVEVWEK